MDHDSKEHWSFHCAVTAICSLSGYSRQQSGGVAGHIAGSTSDVAPDGSFSAAKDHVDFEGRSIVVYRQFQSGARRIAIEIDGSGSSCKATVINGREGGKNIVHYTGRGRAEVFSIRIGSVSCSIREGNVFGQ
jgi:hypothetical protein